MFTSYAQNFEDVLLHRALIDVENGFYIDVGANHPLHDSVTKIFYEMGWSGINIEASPYWFSVIVEDRKRDINLNIAVYDSLGELKFHEIVGTGLSTSIDETAERHVSSGYEKRSYTVQTDTLANICDQYARGPIHFLKVDVEGAEKAVLMGANFQKYRPWIVLIEATEPLSDVETHSEWEHILISNDYEFVLFDGLNRFYLAREQSERRKFFISPADQYEKAISIWARGHLSNEVNELRSQLNTVRAELERSRTAYQEVTSSIFWKATRPFRDVVASLKQIPHHKVDDVLKTRFTEVYEKNIWQDPESVSGPGSRQDSHTAKAALIALRYVTQEHQVRSINDIPCGDFNWIHQFLEECPNINYKGFDIVTPLIERNKKTFPQFTFSLLDITSAIPPKADLIFSKDLLNHLIYYDVRQAIGNMKASGSTYLLASNNFGYQNEELAMNTGGASRHLDLVAAPFNCPAPIWHTNYLGLWKLADLTL